MLVYANYSVKEQFYKNYERLRGPYRLSSVGNDKSQAKQRYRFSY